ncbi:MAG: metal-dependent hydrolase [Algibacter sp.]|uniref:metal-dependent hydrolase n=1 Tax=Algibacter sp. TaxID=1872428 RepID=UPI00262BA513|nr:metal-dependent hydrolase [Algibacter sp.]MDG1728467.1 metal-dependent hydrolase [Algibacter sp.]MDG2178153.1 metal-dependent hydrolase [Algibacter sp.]
MASVFGHGVIGYTLTKVIDNKNTKWLVLAAISSAILPDFDVIAFKLGIAYQHPLGHRGFSHSILFAILWALGLMLTVGRKYKLIWFLVIFLSTISHGILDAMTSGGEGVGFLIPYNNERFFFSFREILVSPLGIKNFFSAWGMQVILSELKYIFMPCLVILLILGTLKKYK